MNRAGKQPQVKAKKQAATKSKPKVPKGKKGRKASGKKEPRFEDLDILYPDSAGIDVGSRFHLVAVPANRDQQPVRKFLAYTDSLESMVPWLKACGIKTVAMESTGVYWIPVYQMLEQNGFEVMLVDSRSLKCVPSRKSDVADCQWLQKLLTYGFLKAAFRPADEICRLRTLQRHRKNLVESVSMRTQHIQKALSEMGVQLHHVLTDILGESGLRILDSILAGERDPVYLAGLVDRRVKKGTEEIVAALKGNYQQEQLFVIAQTLETVRAEQRQIAACDVHILSQLEKLSGPPKPATDGPTPAEAQLSAQVRLPAKVPGKRRVKPRSPKTLYENSLREQLKRILGVDLTQIPGLGVLAVLTLLSEIGTNMNKWHSAKAFASWLGLCPNNKISGGRVLSSRTKHVVSRTATILRMAAMTVRRSQTPLGAFYRRKQAHLGAPKAITATARKIACLIYSLIKEQKEYQEQDLTAYTIDYKKRAIAILRKRAADLDCELVSLQKAA